MGNCMSAEEKAIQAQGMVAVSSNTDVVTDAVLDSALGANALKTKVNLTFEGINLPNLDIGSKTDPFLVLFQIKNRMKTKIGETEVISDTLNPKWVKNITIDYYFEMQ